ncbi:LysR family transcriptional regulator [Streptomyces aurantiacus]|uniref:Putative HTH-type transcriptional regulator LrhA n=1 Tax=Streptomyces aurantiacus JA 4570 TaxID=1286094 RepID=S3ZVT7_9ACTN|nr:LysR family transcriptional regulator [Streptomyces aurantiacus]EPH42520.1 putative HTH-type transcriptional regulator LrhA [Streptomyces aurantiacus JA 4570]
MALTGPTQYPAELLDTTMDQLRTLLAVYETGTALAAARQLGREQSSVQKQLDTMNRTFGALCGEALVLKRGRGKDVLFTATGEHLVELARSTLSAWSDGINDARRRLGRTLSVGSTRYTLGFLLDAVERVSDIYERRGVDLKVTHVRTGDLFARLQSKELDLVCGSIVVTEGQEAELDPYEIVEWRRSGLSILTNLPPEKLPGPSADTVNASDLPALPLVVSAGGLIARFLTAWYGADFRKVMTIAAEIEAAHYGFELLRSGLVSGAMLVTRGIAEAAESGSLPEAGGLRRLDVIGDVGPRTEVLVGVFTRSGDRASYDAGHPLNLLWDALAKDNERWWLSR